MCSVDPPAVAPDAMVHTAGEPLTPAAIIPDEPVARPRGIDIATF